MRIGELFKPPAPPPEPKKDPVPARCPPCLSDLWREVAKQLGRDGRHVSHDEIQDEVCRQAERRWRM